MNSIVFEPKKTCNKCNNTGKVRDKDGSIHVCFDCLQNGNLDQHDKVIKDSNIRL
jgi:hypothetical protein